MPEKGDVAERSPNQVDEIADLLYGLAPAEFTAARNARASEAPRALAKQITALRKPSVAAWAVNLLVRDGQLGQAVELSHALREAQDDLDAAELSALGRQRRALVASLTRRAADLAREQGATLSAAVREAVSETINAAVMDAAAGAAVLTGRLVKPLEAVGFENFDPGEVVAGSVPGVASAPASPASRDDLARRRARKAAEAAARAADRAASEADRERERVRARRDKAREHADLLRERVEGLRAELARISADAEAADAQVEQLDAELAKAMSRSREAARSAARARDALEPEKD